MSKTARNCQPRVSAAQRACARPKNRLQHPRAADGRAALGAVTNRDTSVARAIVAATRRADTDLSACNDDELLASALYADEAAAALRTARAALWSELATRGWSYRRIAQQVNVGASTVHDVVTEYRRRQQ